MPLARSSQSHWLPITCGDFLPHVASKPLTINPGLLRYDQTMSFAIAMLNSVYKAKRTTKKPKKTSRGSTLWLCPSTISFKTEPLRSRPFNLEASEASFWLIISMIIHLRCANLQTNIWWNYQFLSYHHYQNGCIFDGWETLKCYFCNTVKFPVILTPGLMGNKT